MATRRLFLLGASPFSENKQYSLCLFMVRFVTWWSKPQSSAPRSDPSDIQFALRTKAKSLARVRSVGIPTLSDRRRLARLLPTWNVQLPTARISER